jgi:hypothetical protein
VIEDLQKLIKKYEDAKKHAEKLLTELEARKEENSPTESYSNPK